MVEGRVTRGNYRFDPVGPVHRACHFDCTFSGDAEAKYLQTYLGGQREE